MDRHLEIYGRQTSACADCGGERVIYAGEVHDDDATLALFWAFLYDHADNPEIFIDATFGDWGDGDVGDDRVSFGSRTGRIDGYRDVSSSLVVGAAMAPDDPSYGTKLDREQALVHPWIQDFWEVNDMILTGIPEIEQRLQHMQPRRWSWGRRR